MDAKGSYKKLVPCEYRTCYQRDRDRIAHSKAFRRLMNKTQVFLNPKLDHYTTRLTHTLEVSLIARTISRALFLNEDLTEAIALGHDLGHTPFGHAGESALNGVVPFKFVHANQSVRVVKRLERNGEGLSLTDETIDGILNHSSNNAKTLEGQVVYFSDKIAYMNHDFDDAIRADILTANDLPTEILAELGHTKSQRITSFIDSLVKNSKEKISFDERTQELFDVFKNFMFDNVYNISLKPKAEEYKARHVVVKLYEYYLANFDKLPENYQKYLDESEEYSKERVVCDYISGMSDRFAVAEYEKLFIPKAFNINY